MKRRVFVWLVVTTLLLALQGTAGAGGGRRGKRTGSAKPLLAVLPFHTRGIVTEQDIWATAITRGIDQSGKFRVVEREQLLALLKENKITLPTNADVDSQTAVRVGKLLGVNYLLTGAVTQHRVTDASGRGGRGSRGGRAGQQRFVVEVKARLIDISTGEIVWADEVRSRPFFGSDSGVGDLGEERSKRVVQPCVQKLTASLKAADL